MFFSVRFFRQKSKIEIEVVDPQKWYHSIRLDESFQNLVLEPKNLNPFKSYGRITAFQILPILKISELRSQVSQYFGHNF